MLTLERLMKLTLALSLVIVFTTACSEEEGENKTLVSAFNGNDSHNEGKNCMTCHKSGGEGEGWFLVAGTIYNSSGSATSPNGSVKLYTGPNGTGTLKGTLAVDAKGNFYTTQTVDFSGGLYPVVTSASGNSKAMAITTSTGQCNSCHGSTTGKITVN